MQTNNKSMRDGKALGAAVRGMAQAGKPFAVLPLLRPWARKLAQADGTLTRLGRKCEELHTLFVEKSR